MRMRVDVRRKSYGDGPSVLEDLRFELAAGEFVAVVGPSGSGKSTLLNLIAGLDRQFEGEAVIDGAPPWGQRGAAVGMVFQEPRLMPWLTVLDNLRLVMRDSRESTGQARDLLGQVGLEGTEDLFPGQLSLGMQRRVALARALAIQPKLLLMDEPFVSLDVPSATQLRRLLAELCRRLAPSVLFVTHDLREALALAHRILFLSGRPARVVMDFKTGASRSGEVDSPEVVRLHEDLLARCPDLLSGLVSSTPVEQDDSQRHSRWMRLQSR